MRGDLSSLSSSCDSSDDDDGGTDGQRLANFRAQQELLLLARTSPPAAGGRPAPLQGVDDALGAGGPLQPVPALPALPLRTLTADHHAHFATHTPVGGPSLHLQHKIPHPAPPPVFQYPLTQTVSREARHVKSMLRIFGSVESIQHNIAAGKNSGYVNSTQVNCNPRPPTEPAIKCVSLPNLPLTILLNPDRIRACPVSSSSNTDRPCDTAGSNRPDPMDQSFRGTPRTPGARTSTPRGFTCDASASSFFRINTSRGGIEPPPRPPRTATADIGLNCASTELSMVKESPSLSHRGAISPPTGQFQRDNTSRVSCVSLSAARRPTMRVMPNAPVSGDDVIINDGSFFRAETKLFEKLTLREARLMQEAVKTSTHAYGTAGSVSSRSTEGGHCALLRTLFHTKVAVECETAKKISQRGKEDMSKLVTDVKVAMSKLGLWQLDSLDFQHFIMTLMDDPAVPPSDATILFALIDGNGSNQIDATELAQGLELLAMTEDQIILSFCQKMFAEPNKYRNVQLSYHEIISVFRCVLGFYEAFSDVHELLRKAAAEVAAAAALAAEQAKQAGAEDAVGDPQAMQSPPPPPPPQQQLVDLVASSSARLGASTNSAAFAAQTPNAKGPAGLSALATYAAATAASGRLFPYTAATNAYGRILKPTVDTVRRRLESEVATVLQQVWRFSSNKGGQIHVPLLRTLMAADAVYLVQACQAIPASLLLGDTLVLKELLSKEMQQYEQQLATVTSDADAAISLKEAKAGEKLAKKANSTISGVSEDSARRRALEQEKSLKRVEALQSLESQLLKTRPMPYDEVAAIYERYDAERRPGGAAGGKDGPQRQQQPQQTNSGNQNVPQAPQQQQQQTKGLPTTPGRRQSNKKGSVVSAASLLPTALSETHNPLGDGSSHSLITLGKGEVAADPWHPRFTADVHRVQDMERQKLAEEHTQTRYVSEGRIVLRIDETGIKVPIGQFM